MRALITGAALLALLQVSTVAAQAGSLENLERERAIMIQTLLDPSMTPEARQGRIASSSASAGPAIKPTLVDTAMRP